ncbi:Uncharacterised protein [Mycobacterium tuberculosis]|nr:Uncharacterised protein [Mycobacterium tuberculosis]
MATRWRWPPDRSLGVRSRYCVRLSVLAAYSTLVLISSFGTPASFSANDMLSYTLMCGYSA